MPRNIQMNVGSNFIRFDAHDQKDAEAIKKELEKNGIATSIWSIGRYYVVINDGNDSNGYKGASKSKYNYDWRISFGNYYLDEENDNYKKAKEFYGSITTNLDKSNFDHDAHGSAIVYLMEGEYSVLFKNMDDEKQQDVNKNNQDNKNDNDNNDNKDNKDDAYKLIYKTNEKIAKSKYEPNDLINFNMLVVDIKKNDPNYKLVKKLGKNLLDLYFEYPISRDADLIEQLNEFFEKKNQIPLVVSEVGKESVSGSGCLVQKYDKKLVGNVWSSQDDPNSIDKFIQQNNDSIMIKSNRVNLNKLNILLDKDSKNTYIGGKKNDLLLMSENDINQGQYILNKEMITSLNKINEEYMSLMIGFIQNYNYRNKSYNGSENHIAALLSIKETMDVTKLQESVQEFLKNFGGNLYSNSSSKDSEDMAIKLFVHSVVSCDMKDFPLLQPVKGTQCEHGNPLKWFIDGQNSNEKEQILKKISDYIFHDIMYEKPSKNIKDAEHDQIINSNKSQSGKPNVPQNVLQI